MAQTVSVTLEGGAPWGFRLAGGADFGAPLEIARVRKKSKADQAGLKEGDEVVGLDGQDVTQKSHGDAMTIMDAAGSRLLIKVCRAAGAPAAGLPVGSGFSSPAPSSASATPVPVATSMRMASTHRPATPIQRPATPSQSPSAAVSSLTIQQSRPGSAENGIGQTTVKTNATSMVSRSSVIVTSSPSSSPKTARVPPQTYPKKQANQSQVYVPMDGANTKPAQPINMKKTLAPVQPKPVPFQPSASNPDSNMAVPLSQPYYTHSVNQPTIPSQPVHLHQPTEPWTVDISSYKVKTSSDVMQAPSPAFSVRKVDCQKSVWQPKAVPSHQRGGSLQPVSSPIQPMSSPAMDPMSQSWHESMTSMASSYTLGDANSLKESDRSGSMMGLNNKWKQETVWVNEETGEHMTMDDLQKNFLKMALEAQEEADGSSPKKHPGMVNPLIVDEDESKLDNMTLKTKSREKSESPPRKIYSDSTFYDAPDTDYPTIDEQIRLCRIIASTLDSDMNKKSRGGQMFTKRKVRADDWSLISQGAEGKHHYSDYTTFGNSLTTLYGGGLGGYSLTDGLPPSMPNFSPLSTPFGYNQVRPHPAPIKQVLTAQDLEKMKADHDHMCRHNVLPPNVAFNVASALQQSAGKGAKIFAKKRERAEKYVVDESNVRKVPPPPPPSAARGHATYLGGSMRVQNLEPAKPYKSPWEAAMEGNMDKAFDHIDSYKPYKVTEAPHRSQAQLNIQVASLTQAAAVAPPPAPMVSPIRHPANLPPPSLEVKYKPYKPVAPPGSGQPQPPPGVPEKMMPYTWSPPSSGLQSPAVPVAPAEVYRTQDSITYDPYNYTPRASAEDPVSYPKPMHTLMQPGSYTNTPSPLYYKDFNKKPQGFNSGYTPQPVGQPMVERGVSAF